MLKQRGIDCEIYESARELQPLGVGINLLPHATIEIEALGLLPRVAEQAIETSSLHYYNRFGQPIWKEPRGLAAGYPVPQYSIHRGTLQMILAQAVPALVVVRTEAFRRCLYIFNRLLEGVKCFGTAHVIDDAAQALAFQYGPNIVQHHAAQ